MTDNNIEEIKAEIKRLSHVLLGNGTFLGVVPFLHELRQEVKRSHDELGRAVGRMEDVLTTNARRIEDLEQRMGNVEREVREPMDGLNESQLKFIAQFVILPIVIVVFYVLTEEISIFRMLGGLF